jgi:hypothetical protein
VGFADIASQAAIVQAIEEFDQLAHVPQLIRVLGYGWR